MSNPYVTRVNRSVNFARVQLDAAAASADAPPVNTAAHLEAALLHWHLAWVNYLRELGFNYGLRSLGLVTDLTGLRKALLAMDRAPAEADELRDRSEQPGPLRNLLWHSQALFAVAQETGDAEQAIAVTDLDAPDPLSQANLQGWLESFRELLARQRETMAEY